jgi:hypothetical protein
MNKIISATPISSILKLNTIMAAMLPASGSKYEPHLKVCSLVMLVSPPEVMVTVQKR